MANFITAAQAAQLVKDGDTVAFGGFGAYCGPDALLAALGARFRETGAPTNLTSVTGISCGDNSGGEVGMNQVAYEGLLGTIIAGHLGNPPRLGALAAQDKVAAYCLPLGVVMNLYRAIAAKKSGVLTSVGLGTYADPRVEGCKINGKARAQGREVVRLLELGGKAQLFYPAFPINICFIRGSYADEQGNISVEREALTGAELEIAAATRNSGGIVVVQVERIVEGGSLHPRRVRIHRSLVDYVVEAPAGQSYAAAYRPELDGTVRCPVDALEPMELTVRKVIARRAAMELREGCVINLGIGLPSGVGSVANEEGITALLSLESGPLGGVPVEGLGFAASVNPETINSLCDTFDLYDGGYLDMTFLGAAEIDRHGNVNVSKFGTRCTGPGGFINISQNTPRVFFLGTFTAGKSKLDIADGALHIVEDGPGMKFVDAVQQITFSADYACTSGQEVWYITERAVFRLTPERLMLTEIAPGADLERDILAHMAFRPLIAPDLKPMDPRLFRPDVMGIARDGGR